MGAIETFIFRDLRTVEGYIEALDALVFAAILESQGDSGLRGGLAEIGVYYGRSYFLMRRLSAPDSAVLAIDLFDLPEAGQPPRSQYATFVAHGRRLGLPVAEDLVLRCDSRAVPAAEVRARVGPVRFFSIDGGHDLAAVGSDALLARDALADHGVIAFDDTFNPAWPEVTIGVGDFLRGAPDFTVFCLTRYKTYVCHRRWHRFYRDALTAAERLTVFSMSDAVFLGSNAVRLEPPLSRRIVFEALSACGLGMLAGRAYRAGRVGAQARNGRKPLKART